MARGWGAAGGAAWGHGQEARQACENAPGEFPLSSTRPEAVEEIFPAYPERIFPTFVHQISPTCY